MQTVTVEWRHLDKDGATCDRCAETGDGIKELVQQMDAECRSSGVRIEFTETRLSAAEIGQSNLILINGIALEEILPQTAVSASPCCSCGELIGEETSCRTIVRFGQVHEAIPQHLVREAICAVARCCL
jgi:hypothetical protein